MQDRDTVLESPFDQLLPEFRIQETLNQFADRVILAVNGHTHIDHLVRAGRVTHFHCNSASYYWVGGGHKHESYPSEVHQQHEYIQYTCPYRDSLFSLLTFEPESGTVHIEGRESAWVGKSPFELGRDPYPELIDGEQLAPRIRSRRLAKLAK